MPDGPSPPPGSPEALRAAAVAWARLGFRVFPLLPGTKKPLWDGWQAMASSDPAVVHGYWTTTAYGDDRAEDYNVGYCTDEFLIADIDTKHDPRALEIYHDELLGDFDTLEVTTASGGRHLIYSNPERDARTIVRLEGLPIDIKAVGGLAVAPGSVFEGGTYRLAADRPIKPVPAHIKNRVGRPRERNANPNIPLADLDSPLAIDQAVRIARAAPGVREGGRGSACLKLALQMRDFGVTLDTAKEILRDYWAERCDPPFPFHDGNGVEGVDTSVEHAYEYAQNQIGSKSAEHVFAGVQVQLPPDSPGQAPIGPYGIPPANGAGSKGPPVFELGDHVGFGNIIPPHLLRPRDWVIHRFMIRGEATAMIAPGGVGKSQLGIMLAIALARGTSFLNFANPNKTPQKTILYNAEDSLQEMSMRFYAQCMQDGIRPDGVAEHIMLISGKDSRLRIVELNLETKTWDFNERDFQKIVDRAAPFGAAALILDPLAKLHTASESDNAQMSQVMDAVEEAAKLLNAAVLVAHHASKASGTAGLAGNVDASRGASSIKDSARAAFTLSPPTAADATTMGFSTAKAMRYLRLDDAKLNRGLMGTAPTWLEKHSVTLPMNGEDVGAFSVVDMVPIAEERKRQLAEMFVGAIRAAQGGGVKMDEALRLIREGDPLMVPKPDSFLKGHLRACFLDEEVVTSTGERMTLKKVSNTFMFTFC